MSPFVSDEFIWEQFGKLRQEIVEIVDRHTLAAQAWLSSRSPNAQQFMGRGIKASSTGIKVPLLNLALGCNFPPEMSDAEIGSEIEAVKEFFAKRGVNWYWWLDTSPKPDHIKQIAAQHGLEFDSPRLPAMAASLLQDPKTFPAYSKSIQVWRAETLDDLRAASMIRRLAFNFPEGASLTYFDDMPLDWLERKNVKLFLAGAGRDDPSAIGAVIDMEGIAGIYVMATHPDRHRAGLGKAILTRLMAEAVTDGHTMVALTASKKGFGLYSQFGFQHLFDYDFYRLA